MKSISTEMLFLFKNALCFKEYSDLSLEFIGAFFRSYNLKLSGSKSYCGTLHPFFKISPSDFF